VQPIQYSGSSGSAFHHYDICVNCWELHHHTSGSSLFKFPVNWVGYQSSLYCPWRYAGISLSTSIRSHHAFSWIGPSSQQSHTALTNHCPWCCAAFICSLKTHWSDLL